MAAFVESPWLAIFLLLCTNGLRNQSGYVEPPFLAVKELPAHKLSCSALSQVSGVPVHPDSRAQWRQHLLIM